MPCLASPRPASPSHARPRRATPSRALPRQAMPCQAMPGRAVLKSQLNLELLYLVTSEERAERANAQHPAHSQSLPQVL